MKAICVSLAFEALGRRLGPRQWTLAMFFPARIPEGITNPDISIKAPSLHDNRRKNFAMIRTAVWMVMASSLLKPNATAAGDPNKAAELQNYAFLGVRLGDTLASARAKIRDLEDAADDGHGCQSYIVWHPDIPGINRITLRIRQDKVAAIWLHYSAHLGGLGGQKEFLKMIIDKYGAPHETESLPYSNSKMLYWANGGVRMSLVLFTSEDEFVWMVTSNAN